MDPALVALADACGVATRYADWRGVERVVPDATVVAVLGALGIEADTPAAAASALGSLTDARWARPFPPSVVTRAGAPQGIPVHVPHGTRLDVWVETEDGTTGRDLAHLHHVVPPRSLGGKLIGEALLEVPGDLPTGYHTLHAKFADATASTPLIVVPDKIGTGALGPERAWGLLAQLYQVRSARSWGIGDLADLADLADWSARKFGAGFVLPNPLHAAAPLAGASPSPYSPASRQFLNPIYVRLEDIPEVAYLSDPDRGRVAELAASVRSLNLQDHIDRATIWRAKLAALEIIRTVTLPGRRVSAFHDFVGTGGAALQDFATWCVLAEQHGSEDWTKWPQSFRHPASPEVARFRDENADRVALYAWMQWLVAEQLAAAQRTCRQAGMPVGIIADLAVGAARTSAETWAHQDLVVAGVTVGAPPDGFNQQGQDWSLPAYHPDRMAQSAYAPLRDTFRSALRNAGGIRVDHILGLFRQWWIPEDMSPREGTYVRLNHEANVGVLCLEAERARALVVGEDLGTFEPWIHVHLAERGILGTSILWFEQGWAGEPLRAEHWRSLTLASVTVHDLPPTAGYLAGVHVDIRSRLGLLDRQVDEERAADQAWTNAWLAYLAECGLYRHGMTEEETVGALYQLLRRTPARLLGVNLADLVGDRRPVNQPGTVDEYPNWRVPLTDAAGRIVSLEGLMASGRGERLVAALSPDPTRPGHGAPVV